MIKLNRILVGTDFSDHSKQALKYGAALAARFDAELILVHVLEPSTVFDFVPPQGEVFYPRRAPEERASDARALAESWLSEGFVEEAGAKNCRVLIELGHPFAEIVRMARNEKADLIVVGTHGRGAIAHMLLGSVAEKVVRKAPCPVLTVREGEHDFVMP